MTEQDARRAWDLANEAYDRGDFATAIPLYESALVFFTYETRPTEWAPLIRSLGNSLAQIPTGDRGQNLARAIECYQAALRVYTEAAFATQWAMTQNNLGAAYANLPTGDRGENLARAIASYQAALRVRTEAAFSAQWAATQNNLGVAYRNLPSGDRGENLARAIECYQAALRVQTEAAFPADWAMTQNNLGAAYANLPTGDRGENLARAIECYQAALRVRTEAAFPADWAMTQNNLGAAYADLPTGDRGENLARAIECYQAALRVQTEAAFPADWAATQNNQGNAYSDLPAGDRGENLARAIECYQAALQIYTEAAFPADWAITQNNLGIAYENLPTGDRGENLARAIDCYQAALRVRTEAALPAAWAITQNNLAGALADSPSNRDYKADPWGLAREVALSARAAEIADAQFMRALTRLALLAEREDRQVECVTTLREAARCYDARGAAALGAYARRLIHALAAGAWEAPAQKAPYPRTQYDRDDRIRALAERAMRARPRQREIEQRLSQERRLRDTGGGCFRVLREWNSFTPLLPALSGRTCRGGGYFIEWRGRGIAVDPGMDFLRNLYDERLSVLDVDALVLTHNHIDHVGDVLPLLTLLHERNALRHSQSPHYMRLACSLSTYSMFSDLAAHSKWIKALIPLRAGEAQPVPDCRVEVEAFAREHSELAGRRSAVGIRVKLLGEAGDPACTVVLSGDGGWDPDLASSCEGADLLVLHLGGIYPEDLEAASPPPNHLGAMGVFGVLWHLEQAGKLPKLTLISELGEELRGEEGFITAACCEGLGVEYRRNVVEAVRRRAICLPEIAVVCETGMGDPETARCTEPAEIRDIELSPGSHTYEYLCDTHYRSRLKGQPGTA